MNREKSSEQKPGNLAKFQTSNAVVYRDFSNMNSESVLMSPKQEIFFVFYDSKRMHLIRLV